MFLNIAWCLQIINMYTSVGGEELDWRTKGKKEEQRGWVWIYASFNNTTENDFFIFLKTL